MRKFMDEDFMLHTETASRLYHTYAEDLPIVDYHCHIDPQEIYEDRQFENITQLWLGGDHYKWRQMRSNGVDEYYITGDAPDREKFQKWAETLEMAVGNPLYHWSHLELRRYFGYEGYLNRDTAQEVWDLCNEKLAESDLSARSIIRRSNVRILCTTDDPTDSLEWHRLLLEDPDFDVQVLPAWRPDRAVAIESPSFSSYLELLSEISGVQVRDFRSLMEALCVRMDYFASMGCVVSDHGLSYVPCVRAGEDKVEAILAKRLLGAVLTETEIAQFKTAILTELGKEYHRRNWVMQLHYGVKRDNNKRLYGTIGADAGADSIDSQAPMAQLADFLNGLEMEEALPKTIIYSLNPTDNAAIGTIIGCFQGGGIPGRVQQGSAWWFNDHRQGMTDQMTSLANLGLLGNFIGMLTDSRSFLSYTRHEYFRRILCDLIGRWVEDGEYPDDEAALARIITGISYQNAVRYFGFDV